jgi:murein DD-endopeptidase MepM/ murein hydrolase activator NlpD
MKTLLLTVIFISATSGVSPAQTPLVFAEEYNFGNAQPCLTERQREEIMRTVHEHRLRHRPPAERAPGSAEAVVFEWPVRAAAKLTDPGYYGISGFVDHDANYPDLLRDYNCGTRTYDLASGYNHGGTDIFLWPFIWNKMDDDDVEIVAAAAGRIIRRQDGNYDRNCGFGSSNWNGVMIQHDDGSIALYVHMKRWSVTVKNAGSTVVTGEYLGIVGSSGSSTGPHLHFEVWDHQDNLLDPWAGQCNTSNPSSWWANQLPYYDSALNKISTHSAAVEWGQCPNPDITHIADSFLPGSTIYFYAFGRDALMGDRFDFSVYRPDDTEFRAWSYTFDQAPHWSAIAVGNFLTISVSEPTGMWRYQVEYKGVTYEHYFEISLFSAVTFANVRATANRNSVELRWELYADEPLVGFRVFKSRERSPIEIQIAAETHVGAEDRRWIDNHVTPGESFVYTVAAVKSDGSEVRSASVTATSPAVQSDLSQNFPNPFNPSTTIRYTISEASPTTLDVFDTEGHRVVTLFKGVSPTGAHTVTWDGRDSSGNAVSSGLYFYRLDVRGKVFTKKMVLIR